jgi:hypothetical protein
MASNGPGVRKALCSVILGNRQDMYMYSTVKYSEIEGFVVIWYLLTLMGTTKPF